MGWPGAAQGAVAGGMAGSPFGPWGVGIGAGVGALSGAMGGSKGGLSKFGKKRAIKAMKKADEIDYKGATRRAKFGQRQHKRVSREQMKLNKEWIEAQQPIHRDALEQQRRYQNRTARKQIPINARLAGLEDREAYNRALQTNQYANELRIQTQPMREEAAAEQRGLFEKFGLPHKYEDEQFYKKSLLTPQQQKTLDFQNRQARGQKQSIDMRKDPLYKQSKGYLQDLLSGSSDAYEKFKAPAMREFNEQITPDIANRFAGVGAQSSSGFQNAMAHAGGALGEKLGAIRANLQQGALDMSLKYAMAPTAARQQEIQNAQQNAQLGLGTKGFERMYKPALYATPQGGTLAGGVQFNQAAAAPSMAGVGQAQYSPLNAPSVNIGGGRDYSSFFQQSPSGGSGFPGMGEFLSGAGQGAGTAAGNYMANRFGQKFGGGSPTATAGNPSTGANPMYGQGGFSGGGWVG